MPRPLLRSALLLAVVVLSLAGSPPPGAAAQDAPTTESDVLMQATVEGAPIAPAFLRLIRIVLEPGASVPAHLHPGPEYNLVVAGTLTATTDGEAVISTPDGSEPTPAPVGEPFDVTPGQTVVFLPETVFSFQNNGDEAVQLLTIVLHPAGPQRPAGITYPDGDPAPDAYEGVANQILGDGVTTSIPADPVTVTLDQVTLEAGENLPESDSPVLLSLDEANLSVVVTGGDVQVSRTARPGPQPASDTGESYRLGSGDALYFPNGHTEVDRGELQRPLSFLRVTLTGGAADGATPAASPTASEDLGSIEIQGAADATDQPAGESPTPEPTTPGEETPASDEAAPTTESAAGVIPVGSTVVTNDSQINLRDAPNTSAEIVTVLDEGTTLVVISEPVEGENFTWYEVQSLDDPNLRGFMAGDFLDIV
ncbi:MAG: cupin domain-containing protein [Thermomicrobiales bacterium]